MASKSTTPDWQQFQQAAWQQWNQFIQQNPVTAASGFTQTTSNPFEAFAEAVKGQLQGAGNTALPSIQIPPEKLQALQQEYLTQVTDLSRKEVEDLKSLFKGDRRFAGEVWSQNKLSAQTVALYQINTDTLRKMVALVETDAKTRARLEFAVEQWLAAAAPANFMASNPEAQLQAIQSKGESIARSLQNILQDVRRGHISMTDETQFEVGRNIAITPGSVVFENEFFQLIEYTPTTDKVHEKPLLLVPPCINKYYILDLQPGNSFVEYAVAQGFRTFIVSWRNADQSLSEATWDDYIQNAAIRAIEAVQDITGAPTINALGFCVGGTILSTALAVLAARNKFPVDSATLLTTLVDFSDTGILDIFIDENMVRFRELQMGKKGLLPGQDLATTFSFLRPNELVWNYVVGNYLKGETPPPFDLLYWNSDGTNLPGPFYAWYLRNTYLENNLIKPGKLTVAGQKVDFNKIQASMYIYGSREDHIVPITGSYASTQVFQGKKRFVMGASGHIAGVINPPARKKRNYWVGKADAFPQDVNEWIDSATSVPGSWWPDWSDWLKAESGELVDAPRKPGKAGKYAVIEPAPGRYVKQRA